MKRLLPLVALLSCCFLFGACEQKPKVTVIGDVTYIYNESTDKKELNISQIALGRDTVYYLTDSLDVFEQDVNAEPGDVTYVDIDQAALAISAGVAVANDYSLYQWGWQYVSDGTLDALGDGDIGGAQSRSQAKAPLVYLQVPRQIPFGIPVQKIISSECFTSLLTKDGEVYTFGAIREDISADMKFVGTTLYPTDHPVQVVLPEKIIDIACGLEHTVALGESGNVYAFGSYKFGQFGEHFTRGDNYVTLAAEQVNDIVCAGYATFLSADGGGLISYGYTPANQNLLVPTEDGVNITWHKIWGSFGTVIFMDYYEEVYGVGRFSSPFFGLSDMVSSPKMISVVTPKASVTTRSDWSDFQLPTGDPPPILIADIIQGYDTYIFKGNDGYFYRYSDASGTAERLAIYDE
jgi:hypothetical protein